MSRPLPSIPPGQPSTPQGRTVDQLVAEATVPWDPRHTITMYFRSATKLLNQARAYEHQGQEADAFVYYLRYTRLVLEYLPRHPQYGHPEVQASIKQAKVECQEILGTLEKLKARLVESQKRSWAPAVPPRPASVQGTRNRLERSTSYFADPDLSDREGDYVPLGETYRLSSQTMPQNSTYRPQHLPHSRSSSSGIQSSSSSSFVGGFQIPSPYQMPQASHSQSTFQSSKISSPSNPYIPSSQDIQSAYQLPNHSVSSSSSVRTSSVHSMEGAYHMRPQLHSSLSSSSSPSPTYSQAPPRRSSVNEPIRAVTEGGKPLRTIYLPDSLMGEFLRFALPWTERRLETCGILGGKLVNGAFRITHLVLPRQNATENSCNMVDGGEEELFGALSERDLMCVGWIHTHPTQSAFLSSVDLHTHCPYQVTLPEAIAIVCAPRSSPTWGIYRLTDPPGVDVIRRCSGKGFHTHSQEHMVYTDISQGGHVFFIQHRVKVIDLR
ncbi:MAG: hypothetical protein DHS80DRAFT_33381 [Piptocephalis tieghemiana]|nr:MAG: hypothetical protein DHS80DRAFT_33381 [Piptocephalis tieghemiana]